ncbi:hypothetical protein AVEN_82740-1 [Araneus ventricosus]|uniref:Uncharacterized protein n=1 Tax=Araneus ventricosus TaxID=182803 RepID=A0A4Y2E9M2_ARAVE|nr:hypothetical protein AVEN_82740-1 [Araneus ventricosus]
MHSTIAEGYEAAIAKRQDVFLHENLNNPTHILRGMLQLFSGLCDSVLAQEAPPDAAQMHSHDDWGQNTPIMCQAPLTMSMPLGP